MREAIDFKKHWSFWLDWFGSFGREVGCSKPWYTDNPNVFLSTVEHSISTRHHCFLSIQPFRAPGVVFGLEKVFFEFDSKAKHGNMEETFEEVCGFTKRLREHFGVEPLVIWTECGFHVYVFLRNVVEFDFGQENNCESIYRQLQIEMLKGVPHSTLNRNCLGNLKLLVRVPYSMHEEGVQYVPVDFDGWQIFIDDLGEYRKGGITQSLFEQLVEKSAEKTENSSDIRFRKSGCVGDLYDGDEKRDG